MFHTANVTALQVILMSIFACLLGAIGAMIVFSIGK